ncbi:hypothetical protein K438DRAFT_1778697 [Mycena galopus ATCC 62051]|nr:hypothetical protein K438DRAFT_1778697 [Mycena galopus ATCC 62051]
MEIPQELIDAIIDEFPLRLDSISDLPDPEAKRTLQSCALASRSFLQRCQMRLFSQISVWDSYLPTFPLACQRLAAVLSSSPHLAGYIQTLELVYDADNSILVEFVPRILSAVTAVETLQLTRHVDADTWRFPPFDSSMMAVFSLPSLRRLELCNWEFRNPLELQSLLNLSTSLQELALHYVGFEEEVENGSKNSPSAAQRNISSQGLVLESLRLACVKPDVVEMMLESFTTVDIMHLKSLSVHYSPLNGLLRANAGSLQKLRISHILDNQYELDPDIPTSANYLSSIEFEEHSVENIPLRLLDDLANLKAYTRIQIVLSRYFYENRGEAGVQRWAEVDAVLVRAHSAELHISASYEHEDGMGRQSVEVVKTWLPLMWSSGRLHVYSRADCLPLKIY